MLLLFCWNYNLVFSSGVLNRLGGRPWPNHSLFDWRFGSYMSITTIHTCFNWRKVPMLRCRTFATLLLWCHLQQINTILRSTSRWRRGKKEEENDMITNLGWQQNRMKEIFYNKQNKTKMVSKWKLVFHNKFIAFDLFTFSVCAFSFVNWQRSNLNKQKNIKLNWEIFSVF